MRGALSTSGRLEWVGVWRVWFAGEMDRLSDRELTASLVDAGFCKKKNGYFSSLVVYLHQLDSQNRINTSHLNILVLHTIPILAVILATTS